jgi:hypothetical protein
VEGSGMRADESRAESDKAMLALRRAVDAGRDAEKIRKNTDLDSLRDREDFKKLVTELGRTKEGEKANP